MCVDVSVHAERACAAVLEDSASTPKAKVAADVLEGERLCMLDVGALGR